jgi:hypothetical protein
MDHDNRADMIRKFYLARDLKAFDALGVEVERTIRDGVRLLRVVYRAVTLAVLYHEQGETYSAFAVLRRGTQALRATGSRLGSLDRETMVFVLDLAGRKLTQMYEAPTNERLLSALERAFRETGRRDWAAPARDPCP